MSRLVEELKSDHVQLKQRLLVIHEQTDADGGGKRGGKAPVAQAGGNIPNENFSHGSKKLTAGAEAKRRPLLAGKGKVKVRFFKPENSSDPQRWRERPHLDQIFHGR